MTKLRKVRDEREARALLAKIKATNGDIGGWGARQGIDGWSLHAWDRNLSRRKRSRSSRRRSRAADSVGESPEPATRSTG